MKLRGYMGYIDKVMGYEWEEKEWKRRQETHLPYPEPKVVIDGRELSEEEVDELASNMPDSIPFPAWD